MHTLLAGALWIAGAALAGVVLAELALRIWGLINPQFGNRLKGLDLLAVSIAPMGEHGYCQRPNSAFHYHDGTIATSNAMGFRGPEVSWAKPDGTVRIVLSGGSTTHGWCVSDEETIDAYMRRELAARFPGRRFEVINLGLDGYDSFQCYERLRLDGIRLDPDVIILNSGINDVRNARFPNLKDPDPRAILWLSTVRALRALEERGRRPWKVTLKHYSHLARFMSMVRATEYREHLMEVESREIEPNWEVLNYFERNLARVASLVAERGIALVLSTPPSSIPKSFDADATSGRRYWFRDAATTQKVRDLLAERMRRVAAERASAGERVSYHYAPLDAGMFLDDAHLSPAGNERMAREFCGAVADLLGFGRDAKTA